MSDSIKQLTFGVLFNRSFKILDYWGEIADDILYGKDTLLGAEFFTNISPNYTTERKLYNPQFNHSLTLSSNNLIFSQTIDSNYNDEYKMFVKRISKQIIPQIISKYELVVRRLGIVYDTTLTEQEIKKFSSQYFNPTVGDIMDFRFAKKEGTVKGSLFAENSDFINKIYTVRNMDENTRGILYDYQAHYIPVRADVRDCIDKFITNANDNYNSDILNVINGVQNGKKKF